MEVERTNFEIHLIITVQSYYCDRFEPKSHFKSRLSLIVRVNVSRIGLLLLTVTDVSTTCVES